MAEDEGEFPVGYCKPPRNTRFQKGQSGNPGGRPKVAKTLAGAFADALDETVVLSRQGKKKRLTIREVVAHSLAKKAAEGNVSAAAMIHKIESQGKPFVEQLEPEFEVRLRFDEPPVQQPDFLDMFDVVYELTPERLPEEAKELYRQVKGLKAMVRDNPHLFPRSLHDRAAQ